MRFKKQYAKSSEISKGLQKLFSSTDIEILAQESEFVKRPSPMTGHKFAHLCIGGISERGQLSTLTELCILGMKELDVTLCEQSLNERFNSKAVSFMEHLFERAIKQRLDKSVLETLAVFSQINLEDSTQVELPEHLASLFKGSGGI